jgi:hypothetical protein
MSSKDVQQLAELDRALDDVLGRFERTFDWLLGYAIGYGQARHEQDQARQSALFSGLASAFRRRLPGDYTVDDIRRELFEDGDKT